MKKKNISSALRTFGLLQASDKLSFYLQRIKNRSKNAAFRKENPKITLPPDYLIYESFQLDYELYYESGKSDALKIIKLLEKHTDLTGKRILDWGCGPGRIVRHMPGLLENQAEVHGTDYNPKTINWCSENIPGVHFNLNGLEADLPYADEYFDAVYGISIFTHLSEEKHYEWQRELWRILRPGGLMLQSLQGDNFIPKLLDHELEQYEKGNAVIRGQVTEGHRTYSAFHPEAFVKQLFTPGIILDHITEPVNNKDYIPQDIWIIQKQ